MDNDIASLIEHLVMLKHEEQQKTGHRHHPLNLRQDIAWHDILKKIRLRKLPPGHQVKNLNTDYDQYCILYEKMHAFLGPAIYFDPLGPGPEERDE